MKLFGWLSKIKRFDAYYFLTLVILAIAFCGLPDISLPHGRPHHSPATKEQKTSHMLTFKKYGRRLGLCTGTAIGPHAILTAAHCNEGLDATDVTIDLATEDHVLMAASGDGRDHLILLVGGTPFTNIETVVQAKPVVGESVILFGDGGGNYPPEVKTGKVIACEDDSDIDAAAGEFCTSIHVIPGDSGSAVYNLKGEIVGITTYQTFETNPSSEIGFSLDFSVTQLATAAAFDGKNWSKPEPSRANHDSLDDMLRHMFGN
jgi:S1-C subfamily serine protease